MRVLGVLAEVDELARMQLSAVKEAHRAGKEQNVVLANGTIEKWLARPRDLDHSRVIAHDGLEDPKAFAGRDDALRDHRSDDRRVHARLERGDGRYRARVLIAVRQMVEQILGGDDIEAAQRSARPPHALEVHPPG